MKTNNKNQPGNLMPMTLNVVNIQGLRVLCRKVSGRYSNPTQKTSTKQKQKSSRRQQRARDAETNQKRRDLGTNRIYYKSKKDKDQEMYFSDYKIKYGSFFPHAVPKDIKSLSLHLQQNSSIKFHNESTLHDNSEQKQTQQTEQKSKIPQFPQLSPQIPDKDKEKNKTLEKIEQKRKVTTKMQKRSYPSSIKMSFSYKNYKKLNFEDQSSSFNQNRRQIFEHENKLDGWAIMQSPLYEIDRKMDITQYEDREEGVRNYFSERKKGKREGRDGKEGKEDARKLSRSKRLRQGQCTRVSN